MEQSSFYHATVALSFHIEICNLDRTKSSCLATSLYKVILTKHLVAWFYHPTDDMVFKQFGVTTQIYSKEHYKCLNKIMICVCIYHGFKCTNKSSEWQLWYCNKIRAIIKCSGLCMCMCIYAYIHVQVFERSIHRILRVRTRSLKIITHVFLMGYSTLWGLWAKYFIWNDNSSKSVWKLKFDLSYLFCYIFVIVCYIIKSLLISIHFKVYSILYWLWNQSTLQLLSAA